MNVKECSEAVKQREEALGKLIEEQIDLVKRRDTLLSDRAKAVRSLARGDDDHKQRKIIVDLETKISPVALRMEGIQGLISDGEQALKEAKEALKGAEKAEQEAQEAFILAKEMQRKAEVRASMPGLVKEICELLIKAQTRLADLHVASFETDDWPGDHLYGFRRSYVKEVEESNLRPLTHQGFAGSLSFWPLIDGGDLGKLSGGGALSPKEICEWRREQRRQQWTVEFQKNLQRGDKNESD